MDGLTQSDMVKRVAVWVGGLNVSMLWDDAGWDNMDERVTGWVIGFSISLLWGGAGYDDDVYLRLRFRGLLLGYNGFSLD